MRNKKTASLFIRGEGLIPMSVNFKNFYHGVHGVSREPPTALRQGVLMDKYDWFRRKKSSPHTMGLAGFIQPSAPRRKKVFSYQNFVVLRDLRGYILLKLTLMGLIPRRTEGSRSAARYFILIAVMVVSACTRQYDSAWDFKVEREGKGIKITEYRGKKMEVRIPPRIRSRSVISIGVGAFQDCESLTSVTIPDSVTSIGNQAFFRCTGLTSVTIGNGVTGIGNNAFCRCESLTNVTIPDSVISIGDFAFSDCYKLTGVTIPNSVTGIGEAAFSSCFKLTDVIIPNSVISIGSFAFEGCTGLTGVSIPDSVKSIGSCAFEDCESLTSVIIGNSVTSIGGSAFANCKSLVSVTIPDSVTGIGSSAFYRCDSLVSVTIGNSVTSIGGSAFYHCESLTDITMPNSVISIGKEAFVGCRSLTGITIPNSVTSIGKAAFAYCYSLTTINAAADNSEYSSQNGILYNKNKTVLLQYPSGKRDASFTIPNSVTGIEKWAFTYSKFSSLTIPNSVKSIEKDAFEDCFVTSITFQGTIPSSGFDSDAFHNGLRYIFYATDETNGTPGTYTGKWEDGAFGSWTKQ